MPVLEEVIKAFHRTPRFPTRYLEAIEAQIDLAKQYTPDDFIGGDGTDTVISRNFAVAINSLLLLANPIFISPDVAGALGDAMGGIDPKMALYPTDAPCDYGFAYIGGEEWPFGVHVDGFTNTCRAVAWALRPEHQAGIIVTFGRSFEQGLPHEADDRLQVVDFTRYSWGTPLVQSADANAEEAVGSGAVRRAIDRAGNPTEYKETYETVYQRQLKTLTYAAAIWSFMKQKIAVRTPQGFDRPTRRRLEDDDSYKGGSFVSVVHLRALDYSGRKAPEGEPGYHWKVRSIRRAHWHNYPCGGKSKQCAHPGGHDDIRPEPRWVAATVCGPEGAPLRGGTKLFAVVR